jgi:hypothetical protein
MLPRRYGKNPAVTGIGASRDDSWSAKWVAERIAKHDNVKSVEVVSPNEIHVERKTGGSVNIATMSADRVDEEAVTALLMDKENIDFVVNIPKASYIVGNTFALAEERNFAFGGLGDLFGALGSESLRTYVNKEFEFVLRSLRQHTVVSEVTRLDDRRLLVQRKGLEPVTVLVLNDYELTADHVRNGIERYGQFQAIVRSNPNGRVTSAATMAADESGIRIFSWSEFFGQLKREWNWKK